MFLVSFSELVAFGVLHTYNINVCIKSKVCEHLRLIFNMFAVVAIKVLV